jgi:hypothetical protein
MSPRSKREPGHTLYAGNSARVSACFWVVGRPRLSLLLELRATWLLSESATTYSAVVRVRAEGRAASTRGSASSVARRAFFWRRHQAKIGLAGPATLGLTPAHATHNNNGNSTKEVRMYTTTGHSHACENRAPYGAKSTLQSSLIVLRMIEVWWSGMSTSVKV